MRHVGLAEDHCPSRLQPFDDQIVALGDVAHAAVAPGRRQAGDVERFLDRHRHAVQRSAWQPLRQCLVRATRTFVSPFPVEDDDGVEGGIQPLNARAKIFEAFHRAELASAQLRCDVQRALEAQWHYRTSPAPVVSAIYFGSCKRWWQVRQA